MPKPFEHIRLASDRLASGHGDRVVIDADESRFAPGTVAPSRRLGLPYASAEAEARRARVRAIVDALAQALADRAGRRRGQKPRGES